VERPPPRRSSHRTRFGTSERWSPLIPPLATLVQILQVRLVVDANSVIRDVLWMARRRKSNGRTDLLEAIDAGTVVPYVPPALDAEVLERLPSLAEEEEVPLERLQTEWESIRARLRYHTPSVGPRPASVPDHADLYYRRPPPEDVGAHRGNRCDHRAAGLFPLRCRRAHN
jgi:hypothetical protein